MTKTVLVTGATGSQGNAVARHLLKRGFTVRALTRNPANPKAQALAQMGAIIVQGDLEQPDSLVQALRGCDAVFSMQNYWEKGVGLEGEQRQALHMINAARQAGIRHFVQSSIAGADSAQGIPHIESKWLIEEKVRASGLTYTFLRTVFFMDSVFNPKYDGFISMLRGVLDDHVPGHHLIAMDDLGAVAAEVIARPDPYLNKAIHVSSDILSGEEMKTIVKEVTGKNKSRFKVQPWMLWLLGREFYRQMQWNRTRPWQFGLDETRQIYPQLTSFRNYVETHKELV
ncbi:NmrA/HSCARG family protein [Telluribacter humicola]|uniref:NmrA/HSCARG family protein n=1 Tax=Telluribacter humicola TaxID=1720261 RepID=UPI001A95F7AD|nr:NmrA/HSCARG family protein [Telluribacter humicola]